MNNFEANEKEFSILDFVQIAFTLKKKIFFSVAITLTLTLFYIFLMEDEYESYAVLISSNKDSVNQNSFSNFSSGLSALSFIQGNSMEDDLTIVALETIESKDFFEVLISNNIFANLLNKNDLTFEQKHAYFLSKLNVNSNTESSTYRVGFFSNSSEKAYKIMKIVISSLNNYIRDKEVKKASDQITFLEDTLNKTQNPDIRIIISSLIRSNIQKSIISEKSNEYVFTYIDSPRVPENKSRPKRSLILLISLIASFIVSTIILVCIDLFKNARSHKN